MKAIADFFAASFVTFALVYFCNVTLDTFKRLNQSLSCRRKAHIGKNVGLKHEKVEFKELAGWIVFHIIFSIPFIAEIPPQDVPFLSFNAGEVREGTPSSRSRCGCTRRSRSWQSPVYSLQCWFFPKRPQLIHWPDDPERFPT
jgi:hypothetical protein